MSYKTYAQLVIGIAVLATIGEAPSWAASAAELAQQIKSAKAGSVVQLPAGTFAMEDIVLPAGVSLKGAGYDKTIIDASGSQDGIRVSGGTGAAISDLTIKNAHANGISISNATGVRVVRVRSLHNATGLVLDGVTGGRVENSVLADNHVGLVCARSSGTVVVNNTLANNETLSLSVIGNKDSAIFNNLFTGSQSGVTADKSNTGLALDNNLYVALFVGGLTGQPARESLPAWRDLSGYDKHSVELQVEYADANGGTFRPVTPLPWAPVRATSSDWGVAALGAFKAPEKDIDGKARIGDTDLGAYEVQLTAPRAADGQFTVQSGAGVTSAGLFTKDGTNVSYLFQNLPLRKGSYGFWLPKRTPAGSYELRLAESNAGLRYVGLIGGTGANSAEEAPAIDPMLVVYDAEDHPILFQAGNEDFSMARSFDAGLQHNRWRVQGGGGAVAATVDDKGSLYSLQANGSLYKMNAATGAGISIGDKGFRKVISNVFSDKINGMAYLDGKLFVADTGKNKLFVTGTDELSFAKSYDIEAPRWPAADPARGLVWVISGGKLVALDGAGARKQEASPVGKPEGLAIRGNRMAVSSGETHRIHIFDCSDPANLKQVAVLGREWKAGDTGLGAIETDRLYTPGPVAIDSKGNVATVDGRLVKLITADGKALPTPSPFWGQQTPYGILANAAGQPELNFTGMVNSDYTVTLDPKTSTWRPGYRFSYPPSVPKNFVTFFTEGGHNFAVFSDNNTDQGNFAIVKLDKGAGKAVLGYKWDAEKNQRLVQTDSNNNGDIDAADEAKPLVSGDGKPIPGLRFLPDGRLIAGGTIIPRKVDGAGNLSFDWTKYVPDKKIGALQAGGQGSFNGDFLPNGDWVVANGKSRGFGGGFTAIEALAPSGASRWRHPIDYHYTTGAFRSLRVLPGVLLTTATEELDTVLMDEDGLGLGIIGPIPGLNWHGYWHDQDWSLDTFVADGKKYMVLGDYTRHGYHWMEITGTDAVQHSKVAVTVDGPKATALAAAPELAPVNMPKPPTPQVLVRKLDGPMPIDGDLKKWRDKGISPQIIVSPPGIAPGDTSAVIRAAWEGDNLYFQVIKFDDVVTMHQPLEKHYKQDSTELALVGGFMGGYKFSVTHTQDQGDILYREQFLMKKELNLDPAKAPRVIKVLDSAKDVEERSLIEKSFGVDLSNSKVIITEFKIPMSYAWDGKAPVEMKSGTSFWMGLFIDDNDTPGLDEQKAYSWPVTFQAFGNPDQGARATLE